MSPSLSTQRKVDLWNAMRLRKTSAEAALSAVKVALAAGSDPNDGYGTWVPLGWAIRHQDINIARALIEAGADINISENGKPLLAMCLLTPQMGDLVEELIARGATANPVILRTAAKRGNEHIVQWALDAGVDPNDLARAREPVLNCWPAKVPLPDGLLQATFKAPLDDKVAIKIVALIARRKNLVLLNYLLDHGQVSPAIKNKLLRAVIESRWKTGLELLLSRQYCDPTQPDAASPSPIAACANWISASPSPKQGLQVLERLLTLGYDLNATHRSPLGQTGSLTVDAFSLLTATKRSVRPALLAFLLDRNVRPVFTGFGAVSTLVHALIRANEWELLRTLPSRFPEVSWEHAKAPGLLATWAQCHGATRDRGEALDIPPEESLAIVQALPGFDLQRRNSKGESGLRTFMQRPGGSGFSKITTLLMRAGLDPFVPDANGVNDLAYVHTLNLPPGLAQGFEAQALQMRTQQSTGTSSTRRRL